MKRFLPVKVRVKVTEQVKDVLDRHPVGKIVFVRQIADLRLGVGSDRCRVNHHASEVRLQQPIQDLDQGCLAGAVWPEQPDYLAPADLEIHIVQSLLPRKDLGQMFTLY